MIGVTIMFICLFIHRIPEKGIPYLIGISEVNNISEYMAEYNSGARCVTSWYKIERR